MNEERRKEILAETRESGGAFVCHEASVRGEYVVCRGFYDRDLSLVVRLAKLLDAVEFVDTESIPELKRKR